MYDMVIRNGTVVDGTGADRRSADVAVKDGLIVEVAPVIDGDAATTIDAEDRIVTPGFVDIHTHYDGQATWDSLLEPTSGHGVTTLVMGNCGVGFAPVRPGSEDWLIQLMEGVEDIPGAALSEGIDFTWESFPEYLDALDTKRWSVDVGTQVAHGAVRAYAMGQRGAANEPADAGEIDQMSMIVQEAIEAGALGVSTSRTIGHRAMNGEPVPGTYAAEDELFGLGRGLRDGGGGVFELAPAGTAGLDVISPPKEVEWMRRLSIEFGQPVTFALLQVSAAPNLWRQLMDESIRAFDDGAQLHPQVAGRPFGVLVGWDTSQPFITRPSYVAIADLPISERIEILRDPAVKAAILSETDGPGPGSLMDGLGRLAATMLDSLYILGDPPDYEPTPDKSIGWRASQNGGDPLSVAYDAMCADDGRTLLMLPLFNYADGNHDAIREQLTHPQAVSGLSDGGAHCRLICDASLPTTMISHWTRDRSRGERLPLEMIVKKQTLDTSQLFGLGDRGVIEVGKRADLNVIDYQKLGLDAPRLVQDLPAGGRRLLQDSHGYDATIVAGEITRRHGSDTGARPGRLVRGRR